MALLLFLSLVSCADQNFDEAAGQKEGHIMVRSLNSPDSFVGDGIDEVVSSLRILAFDATTEGRESNALYTGAALVGSTLSHSIPQGKYHFIFLANEPTTAQVRAKLEAVASYDEIRAIAYPASSFDSDSNIPMIAEVKNVEVLPSGNVKVDGGSEIPVLGIKLRRLAARVDVLLKSRIDFGNAADGTFKGVSFSKLPDLVPLVWGLPSNSKPMSADYEEPDRTYTGGTGVTRTTVRSFLLANDADYFEIVDPASIDQADKDAGLIWAAKVKRIIIPSSYFDTKDEAANGIVFTVNLMDQYSPSSKLKIFSAPDPDDYRLPANARLELTGIIKEPLEMNIKASEWTKIGADWGIGGEKTLNVSHTSASITDLNGVRISFSSSMPRVRVLETVLKDGTTGMQTNEVFNDLAVSGSANATTRFSYDPVTGNGYMDIIADGGRNTLGIDAQSGTYTLTLSAEDADGNVAIQREIYIKITQNGIRFPHSDWKGNTQYTGIFFRNDEMGERIITGQHPLGREWSVEVPTAYQDWIILSSTPSFDPGVGTDKADKAEKYPVLPNYYKNEDGTKVTGKGRIYFRIGMRNKNPNPAAADKTKEPRYAVITMKFYASDAVTYQSTHNFFIRQGEDPDYLFHAGDPIGLLSTIGAQFQPLAHSTRETVARFSPYNLTAEVFKDESGANDGLAFKQLPLKGGVFVDYPSQSGAFFQWGLRLTNDDAINSGISPFYRRAFNPYGNVKNTTAWISSKGYNTGKMLAGGATSWSILWGASASPEIPPHKDVFETCPEGYRRVADGATDEIVTNGPTPRLNNWVADYSSQIEDSEFRVSLFTYPFSGDANSNADLTTIWDVSPTPAGTYPPSTPSGGRNNVVNTYKTFYADGYFDRRPIVRADGTEGYGVSVGTPRVAYVGLLFVNPDTNASLFFPHTGRISNDWADLQGRGSTGYYWSATAGPQRKGADYHPEGKTNKEIQNGAWLMETQYNWLFFINTYADFGAAIRCVKDDY